MTQGYLLADTNSLVYAHRIGGTKLLDDYYKLAEVEQRLLAITRTVEDEIAKSHRGPELLKYIADKSIPVIPTPQTKRQLDAGRLSRKNAGELSMLEVAAREHAQGRSTVVWSDDRFFASAQELQKAPGARPISSAEMLDRAFQTGAIANDFAGEMQYRKYIENYRAIPAIQTSARLNAFDPPAPGLRVRVAEASAGEVAAIGGRVVVAGAIAAETYATAREVTRLVDQGNITGAQSHVMQFGARASGGAVGAAVAGSVAGSFGGPMVAAVGAAVGGVVGVAGGDKFAEAVRAQHILTQRGSDGDAWRLDERPDHGWMRMRADDGAGRSGMPLRPVYADPRLSDELDYKASSTAVELALAHAPALKNPFSHTPESLGEAVRPGIGTNQPWTRDPQSHAWTRPTTEAATPMTHGVPVQRTVTASPDQALQLDAAAQRVIADNIAHSPQSIAQAYRIGYQERGWERHGPVPGAVNDAEQALPTQQRASDGHEYTLGKDGRWTTKGTVYGMNTAQGQVRDELNATYQHVQLQSAIPATPALSALTPQQIEAAAPRTPPAPPPAGRMSFAEAHQRRDEPEQTSPGSLRPVEKLARPDRIHELTLLREIELVDAKVKAELTSAPNAHKARQLSVERMQDRTHDPEARRLPDEAGVRNPSAVPATPPSLQPSPQAAAPDSQEMHARLAAKEAELAAVRSQMERLTGQAMAMQQASEAAPARAAPAAPARQTDPRDPRHPDDKDFQKIYGVVAKNGRWDARQSASIAAQALADFRTDPLARRLDVVSMELDTRGQLRLFVGHAPRGGLQCLSMAVSDPAQTARAPAVEGFEQLAQVTQRTQRREPQEAQQQRQQQGSDQALSR